jgi:hypothetical protein
MRTRVLLLGLMALFAAIICCEVQQLEALADINLEDTERTPTLLWDLVVKEGEIGREEPAEDVSVVVLVWADGQFRSYQVHVGKDALGDESDDAYLNGDELKSPEPDPPLE